jgi:hypothetical protein
MLNPAPCNVLLIYPRFSAGSFWNYAVTAELLRALPDDPARPDQW